MELLRMDDQRHDVFICFRGDEPFGTSTIRRAIVEPLFDSLTGSGASVFMDDESIESGQPIPDTILQGILRTRGGGAALILVSPDFFSRVWPLIELACFYQAQHYPDQDQIHLFIVCLNVTPDYIKQAAFVKEKCPGVKEIKFVVAPTHIRCNESTQVVRWLYDTVFFWIKSKCVALGRTRTNSFNYFNARLSYLLSQREILETIAIQLGLFQLSFPKDPCSFFDLLAAANKVNVLTEEHIIDFKQALSGLNVDGKFCDVASAALKFVERYNKKWLNSKTLNQVPPLQERRSDIEEWFKSTSRLYVDTNNSILQAVSSQPDLFQMNSMTSNSSRKTPSTPAQTFQPVGQVGNFDLIQSSHAASISSEQTEGSYFATISAFYFCWKNNVPQGYFGTGSLYLIFPQNVDLPSIRNSPNVKIVQVDAGVEFEVDATNTWSWPLTLDEHGILNDAVRNNLALLIASFGLEGFCRFRVHQILSNEEKDHFAVFFMPSEHDIQTARSIFEQEGFMEKFEQAYKTFDTTAQDQVAFCGGCGVVQRTSPDNPYLCRLGHLQAVHILDQPIPQEKGVKVGFEWMPHNFDRRVDLLISCEQHDEIVSSLMDYFLHDTYSVITSENREMSSFLQAVLSTRGGGIALVLMTKNYMTQSRTISELACLYAVRQDIRLIIACVGTTKSQVLQNVIIQELCPDLSSHLFLECDSKDSVDSFLKNKISQELLQHVIPGFRRDQSYLVLKDQLAACFATSPGRLFAKIAINLDLKSIFVKNWSDLLRQAELQGKFGEEQVDQLRQAIVILPETELNSNNRTPALKIIQRYENKWLADWTSKKVPALDKIGERVHLVNSQFRAPFHKTLTGHTGAVFSVAFSPDGKLLASASGDKAVRLWNVTNGKLNAELKGHESFVSSVAFSPDGKSIVTGSGDRTVRTWSVTTMQQLKMLNGHSKEVNSVAWSPNGDLIASGSSDKTVILWDAISGSATKTLTGHANWVVCVSFSQNGNKLVSAGGWDNNAIIWDVDSGAALIELNHRDFVFSVCFLPDDQFVVTGCADNIAHMFNANTGHEEKRFEGHTDPVYSVACSFDGSMIASSSYDKSVRLWDVASTKQLQQLDGHTKLVWSVAFSRDDKYIASGSHDKTVRLWNAPSSLQPKSVSPRFCAALYDFAGTEKGALSFQQNSILSIDGRDENGWAQAKLLPAGASGLIPLNYVEIISEAEAQRRLQQQKQNAAEIEKQKAAAELEKQKQEQLAKKEKELLAKQQEIEKQQKIALEMEKKQQELKKKEEELLAKQQEFAERERKQREELEKQKKQEEEAKKIKANLDPTQVAEWSVDDVCGYLKQSKVEEDVVEIFKKQRIRGQVLSSYAKEDKLKSIGVDADGDRQFVIHVINKLVSPSSGANTGSKLHEIPRHELTKDTILSDKSKFGIVWRGKFNGIPVAIKEPKLYGDPDLIPSKQLAGLIEEATVMTSISAHPNVLHCYGISRVGEDDYLLATELCNLGSLESFLKTYPGTPSVDRRRFSQQVARGLNHLGKHNVAHRDVAARNVLLHDQGGLIVAKVCDFGLSRQLKEKYYTLTGQHLLSPETAPEVYETRKHSTRSDVWSFGVLLWEVESLCAAVAMPDFSAFPPLSKPAQASENMYVIMLKCWAFDPDHRPSFEALVDMLS